MEVCINVCTGIGYRMEWFLLYGPDVQGRITETQLPLAEKSFPGISEMYNKMQKKPLTFLQLLWMYESAKRDAASAEQTVLPVPGVNN